jgi:arylformamidase
MIDYEGEYNMLKLVPERAAIGARWAEASAGVLQSASSELDIPYGPGLRNRYDLFLTSRRGTKVPLVFFIHGGVWQRGDRKDYSFVVPELLARGVDVAVPSYTLCPEALVPQIFGEIRDALRAVWRKLGRRPLVVGHSVGGTMAAAMLATDWRKYNDVPEDFIRAAYAISGVFDVEPYVHTTYNAACRMSSEQAVALSPASQPAPAKDRTLVAAVGGAESNEFVRQSLDIAARWSAAGVKAECVIVPGANHFTVVDELARGDSAMLQRVAEMARAVAGN